MFILTWGSSFALWLLTILEKELVRVPSTTCRPGHSAVAMYLSDGWQRHRIIEDANDQINQNDI